MRPPDKQIVTSYGLDRSVISWVVRPQTSADLLECIDFARSKRLSICPAGGRNSFGDIFLLGDHVSLDLRQLNRILQFDPEGGTITAEAGALTSEILGLVMPVGWHLPSVSGSPWNTIGGDLSSNVNGKDSWHAGTFGDQVVSLKILLADGSTRQVSRETEPALFNAVIGGLGLLGIVSEVTLRLRPIPSPAIEEQSQPTPGVVELIEHFARLNPAEQDLSYAWVDAFPRGRAFGRAVCASARFIESANGFSTEEFQRQLVPPATIFGLPPETFWKIVSHSWRMLFSVGLHGTVFRNLNRVKYFAAVLSGERVRTTFFPEYQYPMTRMFPHWNLKFAPDGFNEIQALFPAERFEAALRALVAMYGRYRRAPEVCGVRRHRPDSYDLSFAGDGLSFALAFALAGFRPGELGVFRRALVDQIMALGGKVYLSKFPYLDRAAFQQMYPKFTGFMHVKHAVDPDRLFWSDAAERLLS